MRPNGRFERRQTEIAQFDWGQLSHRKAITKQPFRMKCIPNSGCFTAGLAGNIIIQFITWIVKLRYAGDEWRTLVLTRITNALATGRVCIAIGLTGRMTIIKFASASPFCLTLLCFARLKNSFWRHASLSVSTHSRNESDSRTAFGEEIRHASWRRIDHSRSQSMPDRAIFTIRWMRHNRFVPKTQCERTSRQWWSHRYWFGFHLLFGVESRQTDGKSIQSILVIKHCSVLRGKLRPSCNYFKRRRRLEAAQQWNVNHLTNHTLWQRGQRATRNKQRPIT